MTHEQAKSHSMVAALRVGVRALFQYPLLGALFLATTVSQGMLQGLFVWSLRYVLIALTEGDGTSYSAPVWGAALILGIWVLRATGTYVGEVVAARLARRVEIDSMQRLLAKLLTLSVRFFERNSQGDLVMTSYEDLKGVRTVTVAFGQIILSISRLVGLAVVAWMMSPKLAMVGLVTVPFAVVPAYLLGWRITVAARAERGTVQSLYDSFLQVASGIRVIKVNRWEPALRARAAEIGSKLYRYGVRQVQLTGRSRLLLELVSGLGLIAVLIVGARDVAMGILDWQSLMGLLVAVMGVYTPVVNLLQVYGSVRTVIPNLDRVDSIFRTRDEVPDVPNARPLITAPTTIELQDVTFAYDSNTVLDSISATFHQGETIGIVGPSGTGKSTLLALLLRFDDPTEGRILFDGVDLREIRHADLIDKYAIVLQEPFLFIDTIANNIRLARPGASMDDVVEAARAANIHDEITQMPQRYETVVGHHKDARGISVGQKQRISIAAALLKNAPILLMDEATSNLDSVAERKVQVAIERLMERRTTFIVAHRLSTLRTADRILVLDRGRMVGLDYHSELLERCPTYRRLWEQQSLDALSDPVRREPGDGVADGDHVTGGVGGDVVSQDLSDVHEFGWIGSVDNPRPPAA